MVRAIYIPRGQVHGFLDAKEIYPEIFQKAVDIIKEACKGRFEEKEYVIPSKIENCKFKGYRYKVQKFSVDIGKVSNSHSSVNFMRISNHNKKDVERLEIILGIPTKK